MTCISHKKSLTLEGWFVHVPLWSLKLKDKFERNAQNVKNG